ncbi:MAG: hypothetical protein KAS99_06600 [Candidatus Omnitrophica bacterium]|nr:hypothetical protein [Candidatus Omnitrophota bacterium]
MSVTMDKELLIRLPSSLYKRVKAVCGKEYKSISALVRELLLEKVDESLSEKEMKLIAKQSEAFHKGEGTNWREIKRG